MKRLLLMLSLLLLATPLWRHLRSDPQRQQLGGREPGEHARPFYAAGDRAICTGGLPADQVRLLLNGTWVTTWLCR
jgi:hypothetical protein